MSHNVVCSTPPRWSSLVAVITTTLTAFLGPDSLIDFDLSPLVIPFSRGGFTIACWYRVIPSDSGMSFISVRWLAVLTYEAVMALSCWAYNTVAAAPVVDRLSCLVYSYPGAIRQCRDSFNGVLVISSTGLRWPIFCSGSFPRQCTSLSLPAGSWFRCRDEGNASPSPRLVKLCLCAIPPNSST